MNRITYVWLKNFIPFTIVLVVGLRLGYDIFIEISAVVTSLTSYIFVGFFLIGVLGVLWNLFKMFLKNLKDANVSEKEEVKKK